MLCKVGLQSKSFSQIMGKTYSDLWIFGVNIDFDFDFVNFSLNLRFMDHHTIKLNQYPMVVLRCQLL